MAHGNTNEAMVTIGLDLGDRQTAGCVVDEGGQRLERFQARTTPTRLLAAVSRWPGARPSNSSDASRSISASSVSALIPTATAGAVALSVAPPGTSGAP